MENNKAENVFVNEIDYEHMVFWFERKLGVEYPIPTFDVYQKTNEGLLHIGVVEENSDPTKHRFEISKNLPKEMNLDGVLKDILSSFSYYTQFSLVDMGKIIDVDNMNREQLEMAYDSLLYSALFERKLQSLKGKDQLKDINSMIEDMFNSSLTWLKKTDFYTCPASTKYHDSDECGLLRHTLKVYNNIIDLFNVKKFSNVNLASATLVALVHDWCKIGLYKTYQKNVKDDKTGQWHKEFAYTVDYDNLVVPLGHGTTSMFFAVRMFRATIEEALALRWHMGEYNVADNEMNELHSANERYPLVQMLQFADRLSIVQY